MSLYFWTLICTYFGATYAKGEQYTLILSYSIDTHAPLRGQLQSFNLFLLTGKVLVLILAVLILGRREGERFGLCWRLDG